MRWHSQTLDISDTRHQTRGRSRSLFVYWLGTWDDGVALERIVVLKAFEDVCSWVASVRVHVVNKFFDRRSVERQTKFTATTRCQKGNKMYIKESTHFA
jgi:hypothetical protein